MANTIQGGSKDSGIAKRRGTFQMAIRNCTLILPTGLPMKAAAIILTFGLTSACSLSPIPDSGQSAPSLVKSSQTGHAHKKFATAASTRTPTPLAVIAFSESDLVKSALSADHGDAAWICSPSGFGQKSKCRKRTEKG